MALYDYLEYDQVKVFYRPTFDKKYGVQHIGGQLRNFLKGSPVPTKELWYKYPKDFLIFNYQNSDGFVYIIKNGCFEGKKNYVTVDPGDLAPVYDFHGRELTIKNPKSLALLLIDYKNTKYTYYKKKDTVLAGKSLIDIIQANNPAFNREYEPLLDEVYRNTLGKFYEKWHKPDSFKEEKQFGELLACYLYLRKVDKDRFAFCKQKLTRFLNKTPTIIDRYLLWHGGKWLNKMLPVLVKEFG